MEQVTKAVEIGAAALFFAIALFFGTRAFVSSEALLDDLEAELRQERCVEEMQDG